MRIEHNVKRERKFMFVKMCPLSQLLSTLSRTLLPHISSYIIIKLIILVRGLDGERKSAAEVFSFAFIHSFLCFIKPERRKEFIADCVERHKRKSKSLPSEKRERIFIGSAHGPTNKQSSSSIVIERNSREPFFMVDDVSFDNLKDFHRKGNENLRKFPGGRWPVKVKELTDAATPPITAQFRLCLLAPL